MRKKKSNVLQFKIEGVFWIVVVGDGLIKLSCFTADLYQTGPLARTTAPESRSRNAPDFPLTKLGELNSCPYNFQKLEICPYNSRNWRFALHILALPELWPFLHMKPSWTHLQHLYVCIGPKCPPRQEEKGEANG